MKIICGWCGQVMSSGVGEAGEETSHSICVECSKGLKNEAKDGGLGEVSREERNALLNFDYEETV